MNSFSPLCSGSDSEYEAHSDYYGFPSNPVSIYHTGDPWSRPKGPDAQRVPKEARPVTNPKLALVWNKLGRRIYEYLDEAKAKWSSIDLVRFAEVGKKSGPIFIWVGIVPKSLTREGAEELAIGCKEILMEFHFADIEIAFRESVYNQLAGQKLLNYVDSLDPTAGVRGPFTPAVGLRISPMSYPFYSGTGGVYFCEGGDSERILFITARHVVFPPPHESNEVYVYNNNSAPRLNVMLSNKSYGDTLESIQTQIDSQEQMVDLYQRRIKHFASTGVNTLMKYSYLLEESQQSIVVLKEFLGEIDGNWGTASKRILGHVIYSPPISVGIGPQLLTEDWAIVELYQAKLDSETFKGNVIDLGTTIHPHDFTRKMYPDDTVPTSFKYPDDRLLKLRNFLREDELTPTATGQDDEPYIMVLKNGHATGVTIGRATGIKSFVRKYDDFPGYDIPSTSMEIPIHSYGNETPFSGGGDSGSIVADGQGRLVGLVTGGAGMINSIDVTYVTPYYWLDERIKSVFPEAYLYPAMP